MHEKPGKKLDHNAGKVHWPMVFPPVCAKPTLFPTECGAVRMLPWTPLGVLHPEIWPALFQDHRNILEPVRPWLWQYLQETYGTKQPKMVVAKSLIISTLCLYELHKETPVKEPEPTKQHHTGIFVHGLIKVIVYSCSKEAERLLGQQDSCAARGQADSSGDIPLHADSQSQLLHLALAPPAAL